MRDLGRDLVHGYHITGVFHTYPTNSLLRTPYVIPIYLILAQ